MPMIEKVDTFEVIDPLYKTSYYHDNKHAYSTTLNLLDTCSLEFKLSNCGTITDETILKKTIKHISIWPKITIVETNNCITLESISTSSLYNLINFRINTLNKHNNNDDDTRTHDIDISSSLSKEVIQTTKKRLEYIKSVLPIIIILEAKEWKITETGRIHFSLRGHEGLKDLVSVFDVDFQDWVSRTLSVISLDTEAVFYPHLDILDVVLDHNALLSTYKLFNTRLERHVIFRLKGVNLVITSPLYSGQTNGNFFDKIKNHKNGHFSSGNDGILFMIEKGLYKNHHSVEKIKNILAHHHREENYGCIQIDKNYRYSVNDGKKKEIPLMLTESFIPGYTTLVDNDEENNNEDDNDDENNNNYNDDMINNKKLKTVPFLVSCAFIKNVTEDDLRPNEREEENGQSGNGNGNGGGDSGSSKSSKSSSKSSSSSSSSSDDVGESIRRSRNISDLLSANNNTIKNIEKMLSKNNQCSGSSSFFSSDTVAIFNSFIDADQLILCSSSSQGHKNIKVDIKIDGRHLLSSAVTGLDAKNGSFIFRGGRLVARSDGRVHFRPIFSECFPEHHYRRIPIGELVSYLLETPLTQSSIGRERNETISSDRYQPAVELLYQTLLTTGGDHSGILSRMNELTSLLAQRLFGVCNPSLFSDRLWNMSHWDFPVGVVVCLYGRLLETLSNNNNSSSSDDDVALLWNTIHQAVLERLLVPVFDSVVENGVWVAPQVRSFLTWVVEGTLLPLLTNATTRDTRFFLFNNNVAVDVMTSLAFQWIAIESAAENGGLCKCFPNNLTWFYMEPNRKMIDYIYSPIPKFIMSDHKMFSSEQVPVTSKTVHLLIQKWISSKRIGDRIFAVRNLVTPVRQSFLYSIALNSLDGLMINIRGSPSSSSSFLSSSSGDDDNHNNFKSENADNDTEDDDDDPSVKYCYSPPLALSEPSVRLLSLGSLRELKMLESSLRVTWVNNNNNNNKKSPLYSASEIIKKIIKQKTATTNISEETDSGGEDGSGGSGGGGSNSSNTADGGSDNSNNNDNNNSNDDDDDTCAIREKYIALESPNFNVDYWMSQLSCETLRLLTEKKESAHSFIDSVAEDLPLSVIEEMASPIINNCITFYQTDNGGFSWLFDYGLNHNRIKPSSSSSSSLFHSQGSDKLDKLLSIVYRVYTQVPESTKYHPKANNDNNKNTISGGNIVDNNNNRMRTLIPFQFLEHMQQIHSQKKRRKNITSSSPSFNVDSTLVFIYKKLPEVLESIMLRLMITSESEEIELVRKLAINVSRILADSLLICLDPRNAYNIKMTLEEPITLVYDEIGAFSLNSKGKISEETNSSSGGDDNIRSIVTEILSSSRYLSLIGERDVAYKDMLREYFKSLNFSSQQQQQQQQQQFSGSGVGGKSVMYTKKEQDIIDRENCPIQKNIKNRRGLEHIDQAWTDENINRPYIVPTFRGNNGDRFVFLTNMPDNLYIYVPIFPTSFLMAEQIKSVLEIAKDKIKHVVKHREYQSTVIRDCNDEIQKRFVDIWGSYNSQDKIQEAINLDILSVQTRKQDIAIKNKKLLSSLPVCLDISTYRLHLAIKSMMDIDYYIKVPNFWRLMDIEEMLQFAVSVMLITLQKLVDVGLNTARRYSEVAETAQCLQEAEINVIY
uniref:Wsv289-like protein n=1 Tax=Litopenaeus vannamei majanivirus Nimav-1_LVa TaxID=2984273 RepID=A0A9C7F053_9VIRU|nr:MAG: wsv289-like protein [Litopenaeus vannamei majanivirus Nimav-1_LVa]